MSVANINKTCSLVNYHYLKSVFAFTLNDSLELITTSTAQLGKFRYSFSSEYLVWCWHEQVPRLEDPNILVRYSELQGQINALLIEVQSYWFAYVVLSI